MGPNTGVVPMPYPVPTNCSVYWGGCGVGGWVTDWKEKGRGREEARRSYLDALAAVLGVVPHGAIDGHGQAHVIEATGQHAGTDLTGTAGAVEGGLKCGGGGSVEMGE